MGTAYMSICPKCADFKMISACKFCNMATIKTSTSFGEALNLTDKEEKELVNYYIETLIKDTYDPKARQYREANEKPAFADYVHESQITCPTCHSTNVQKITTAERAVSVGMLGIFSNKINKSYKCKSCGYRW